MSKQTNTMSPCFVHGFLSPSGALLVMWLICLEGVAQTKPAKGEVRTLKGKVEFQEKGQWKPLQVKSMCAGWP